MALVAALAPPAAAQKRRGEAPETPPAVDPYTGGRAEDMARAGYVKFGPLLWGDRHDTAKIERVTGGVPLLWVETAHFRIGSSLPAQSRPTGRDAKRRFQADLKRLAERLPEVDTRARKIDPWLRLHLLALRLEDLYTRFCEVLAVTDDDFADAAGQDGFGQGPYLGQPGKYCVLVFEKKSSWARYATTYLEAPPDNAYRCLFEGTGSLFYGTAWELLDEAVRNDTAMHCNLAFGVVSNLVDGFGGFTHNTPPWLQDGLAHCLSREIDPKWTTLSGENVRQSSRLDAWKWEPRVRGRVKNDACVSFHEMMGWRDRGSIDRGGQMVLWSRVDYLVREHPGKIGALLREIKAPIAYYDDPAAIAFDRQPTALVAAFETDVEALDEGWREFVLDEYPAK